MSAKTQLIRQGAAHLLGPLNQGLRPFSQADPTVGKLLVRSATPMAFNLKNLAVRNPIFQEAPTQLIRYANRPRTDIPLPPLLRRHFQPFRQAKDVRSPLTYGGGRLTQLAQLQDELQHLQPQKFGLRSLLQNKNTRINLTSPAGYPGYAALGGALGIGATVHPDINASLRNLIGILNAR